MTITLFHGPLGLLAAALICLGAASVLTSIENWLRERFALDLNPYRIHLLGSRRVLRGSLDWDLHFTVPRRLKAHLRWDRPFAMVRMGDGREGCLLYLLEHDDAPSPIALVQPYDDNDASQQCPEWVPLDALMAAPRRSFRETWREMRAAGNGDA